MSDESKSGALSSLMSPGVTGKRVEGKRDGESDRGQIIPPVAATFSRTVIWQLSLTEPPSFAKSSQAPQPPAPKDAGAPGHKAPAQGDKGFNYWANTDDSFDKCRRGMADGGGEQSFPAHSLSFSAPCLPVSVISLFCTMCFSSYNLFPSVSLQLSLIFYLSLSLYLLYPVLCEFGSDRRSSPRSAFLFIPYL